MASFPTSRLRRNRKSPAMRSLVCETHLLPSDIVAPFFLIDGEKEKQPLATLPGHHRLSIDSFLYELEPYVEKGLCAVTFFPMVERSMRDDNGSEAFNERGLIPKALRAIKRHFPHVLAIADVALDPYTSHGHDGIVVGEKIHNDLTLQALGKQALILAQSGADVIAPSDMMDGRVGYIRSVLDQNHFEEVNILSYSAKYASSFYGPFRDAISTKLSFGDKATYQMAPTNRKEALLEAKQDMQEGADLLMVKPALSYLDVIYLLSSSLDIPVGAYHVSGEYAMIKAAHKLGYLDEKKALNEVLLSIKRAGATFIYTYAFVEFFASCPRLGSITQPEMQKLVSSEI